MTDKITLDKILERLSGPNEAVEVISSDNLFRISTNIETGLIILEHLDQGGQVMNCVVRSAAAFSCPVDQRRFVVLRFRCFLEAWVDRADTSLTIEQADQVFHCICRLTDLSLGGR